jgi:DNA-binding NtrC family response regulator
MKNIKQFEAFLEKKIDELQNVNYYIKHLELERVVADQQGTINSLTSENKELLELKKKSLILTSKAFLGLTIVEIQQQVIVDRLKFYKGNKSKTAETLGITIKTLYNLLHEYDLHERIEGLKLV